MALPTPSKCLGSPTCTARWNWIRDLGCTVMNLLAKGSLRHVTTQLGKQPSEHFADIGATVEYASDHGVRCNIYLEDWSGGMLDSPDYVLAMLDELAGMGLWRIMLPVTLGLLSPSAGTPLRRRLGEPLPRIALRLSRPRRLRRGYGEYPGPAVEAGAHLRALHDQRHGRTRRQHAARRGSGRGSTISSAAARTSTRPS